MKKPTLPEGITQEDFDEHWVSKPGDLRIVGKVKPKNRDKKPESGRKENSEAKKNRTMAEFEDGSDRDDDFGVFMAEQLKKKNPKAFAQVDAVRKNILSAQQKKVVKPMAKEKNNKERD